MTTHFEPIYLEELTGFLLSQEAHLEENSVSIDMPAVNLEVEIFLCLGAILAAIEAKVAATTRMTLGSNMGIPPLANLFVKSTTNQAIQQFTAITGMNQNFKVTVPLQQH